MAKPRSQSKTDTEPKSEALKNFESNLDGIVFFINETGTKHLQRRLKVLMNLVRKKMKDDVITDSTRLAPSLSKVASALENDIRMIHFRSEWIGVMLITFLMAYLEDCLIILAERNNSLLRDLPTISSNRVFEATSIDEIKVEIKKAWAERFLQGVGPEGWAKRLSALGVRGYDAADISAMQHLFDTRNCVIHTNGIARQDYVKKYPSQRLEGGRIQISLSELGLWAKAITNFVKTTDAFLLNVGPHIGQNE